MEHSEDAITRQDDAVDAIVADRPGPLADVLAHRTLRKTQPLADHEVDVAMLASTVNPSDAVTVSGAYGSRTTFPFVPGFEGVGVIQRVGSGVPASAIGCRVLPIGSAGNWQQIKRTAYSWCVPVPDDIPDDVACFAYINPLTALLMVQRYCTGSVQHVAITAATSTIAGQLAELLDYRGIQPVGSTRGTPGRTVANPNLWREVISTGDSGWQQRLRRATGPTGCDVIFDSVGGALGPALMDQLQAGGVLVHYGLLSGEPLPAACFTDYQEKSVAMFRLRDIIHTVPQATLANLFAPVFEHLRAGRLHSQIAQRIPLRLLPQALKQPSVPGKLLITYDA